MKYQAMLMLLLAGTAHADMFSDVPRAINGRVGSSPGSVMGRGLYTSGKAAKGTFTQGGGEISGEFGFNPFPTKFHGIVGIEGELNLGLMRSEEYADASVVDQRNLDKPHTDLAVFWLTTRLGLRMLLSPPPLELRFATFRLSMMGGAQLEGNGARSWTMAGAFTCGAQLVVATRYFATLLSWLAIPPQGDNTQTLVRHQLSLDIGIGAVVIGARLQIDHLDIVGTRGGPGSTLDSQTFSLSAGYRWPDFKL